MPPRHTTIQYGFVCLLLAACGPGGPFSQSTPTPEPPAATPTPTGPQTLNICTANEPASLYLYGDQSAAADTIRQAIYDGPIDFADYAPQPVILESLPNLEDGSALIQTVTVQPGDWVVDVHGAVAPLLPGLRVHPAGCRGGDCALDYTGGELPMDQVQATFTLRSGLTWADGQPLTADDSVYSFELNADPATGADTSKVDRTASYVAADLRTAVWTGLPGFLDPDFQTNFWSPLPRHAWGQRSATELLQAEDVSRNPLGWGPYAVEEWIAGESITLSRNPNYWRAGDDLPHFSTLNIYFAQATAQALQDGTCDLVLPSAATEAEAQALIELADEGEIQIAFAANGAWEHLAFGAQPLTLDDGFNLFVDGPHFFGDVRVRQAFALCIDRQALINEFAYGQGAPPASYLHPDHWLAAELSPYVYDPAAGAALLEEAGWIAQGEGARVAAGFSGAVDGITLRVQLHIDDSQRRLAIAQSLANSLDDCGIELEILSAPAEEVFAAGPEGELFGRDFQLGQFSWPLGRQPACHLYLSSAIPGPDLDVFPFGWGGWNLTGWSNTDFDLACQLASHSLPGESSYGEQHFIAQQIFVEQLPAVPLFLPQSLVAMRTDFCGFAWRTGSNPLQPIEEFGYAEWCD